MPRYAVYLDPQPAHDGPDYPETCPETPPGYVRRGYLEWHDYAALADALRLSDTDRAGVARLSQ